jgi:hypothetical protein
MRLTRRALLGVLAGVTASPLTGSQGAAAATQRPARLRHLPRRVDLAAVGALLRRSFPDLQRRFIFEYYAWYATDPWRHWDENGRIPPIDIAATAVPALGAYDTRSVRVLEQHARWIREAGVGAINISWWGRDNFADLATSTIMDVMHDHDIKVTFHLEPYAASRGERYADDIRYLLDKYGEKRRWDAFLLLRDERGCEMPIFKSFATIQQPATVDCHGVRHRVRLYVSDGTWRQQTDRVRDLVRRDFARILLFCDSTDLARLQASGFDGVVPYGNSLRPETAEAIANDCGQRDLLFSFNINPGFDAIVPREIPADSCYRPTPFEPPTERPIDWDDRAERLRAEHLSLKRIRTSLTTTLDLQIRAELPNRRRGFFLVYVNSFNEWHEGHAFEPAKDYDDLTPVEQHLGYHNPNNGSHRLQYVKSLLDEIIHEP